MDIPSASFLFYTAKYTLLNNDMERFSIEWKWMKCNSYWTRRVIVL